MAVCRSCGTQAEEGSRFCPVCGTPAAPVCAGCGAGIEPDALFCGVCGRPMAGMVAPPAGPPPAGQYWTPPTAQPARGQSGFEVFIHRLLAADWIVLGGGVVAFIASFLGFYVYGNDGMSYGGTTAWDSTWSGLAIVLCVAAAVIVVLRGFEVKLSIPPATIMTVGIVAAVFLVIEFIRKPGGDYAGPNFGVGLFLATLAAIAIAVGGYIRMQNERGVPAFGGAAAPVPPAGAPQWSPGPAPGAGVPPAAAGVPFVAAPTAPAPTVVAVAAAPAAAAAAVAGGGVEDEAGDTVAAAEPEPEAVEDAAVESADEAASAGAADAESEDQPTFCVHCGQPLSGRPFCTACGKPVA